MVDHMNGQNQSPPPRGVRQWFTWKNLRRGLIGLAAFITLTALFYTEENWRGRRAWEQCRSELQARGAVVDWDALIAPVVPDDQNIFKAPRMQEWFVGRGATELSRRLTSTNSIPGPINRLSLQEATNYLAWSRQFDPDFDLIRQALKRPYARMDGDYGQPFAIPIPNFVAMRVVAQTLAKRAQCHLLLGEPEKAWSELSLMHDSCRLLEAGPTGKPMTLVAAMINVAITGLYVETVADGFRLHAWREPQLAAIQEQLRTVDLPPLVAETFREERIAVCRTLERTPPALLANQRLALTGASTNFWHRLHDKLFLFSTLAPRGWIYQNMSTYSRAMEMVVAVYDPASGRISPAQARMAKREIERRSSGSPYTLFAFWALPNYSKAWQTVARNQTLVDEARVACALERYRLAQGVYPETLDPLVPRFLEKLPHDIINGQPLHYRRTADGRFLLYSVGWNETDDGGLAGTDDGHASPDERDWVWPPAVQ
jgi:hypothetical protein